MNQTSHPPARSTKQWMRALCTLVFTFVFAFLLTSSAHAQRSFIQINGTPTPEFDPANPNTPYYFEINFGTFATSAGPPPVRPPISQTSIINFVITGDFLQTGRAAFPSGDMAVVPTQNVTYRVLANGDIAGRAVFTAGGPDFYAYVIALQDAETEPDEGYRIYVANVESGSFFTDPAATDAYGVITDTSPQNGSPFTLRNSSGTVVSASNLNFFIGEGFSDTFTITPNTPPSQPARIQLSTSDASTISVSPNFITFPAGSTQPQTVVVTALSDNLFFPNVRTATVQISNSTSLDPNFNNGVITTTGFPVTVFNTDTTSSQNAGFSVSLTSLVVSEGGTATFTVTINAAPKFDVYVPLTISDPTVARIVGTNVLTFRANDSSAANLTQTVTVSGISDNSLTPPVRATTLVTGNSISTDAAYNNLVVPDVNINVLNTDTLFKFSRTSGLITRETGSTDSFTVALNVAPTANVNLVLTATSTPNEEVRLRTGTATTATSSVTLTFTPANYATPQTVTVVGVNDNVADGPAPFTITGTATSTDPNYAFQSTQDITGINIPAVFNVSPTSGLTTKEDGSSASFTAGLNFASTSPVTVVLSISPTSEATFAGGAATQTIVFPTGSVATQTVTVFGVDDSVLDGDKPFTVTGTITTTDANIIGQAFPSVTGINQDNEIQTGTPTPTPTATPGGGNNGTGPTYAAGTRNLVSFPYTLTTDGEGKGTATVAQAFGSPTSSLGVRYTLYRYNAEGQKYSFTTTSGALGTDWVPMNAGDTLALGQGYLLVVGNAGSVSMNTPADDATLTAITSPTFQIALKRNPTFVKDTRKTQSFNGYNLIGFPFDPSRYTSVNLSNVQVISSTNGRPDVRYESLSKAAAAGVIKGTVYGIDSQGRLVALSASNYSLARYKAVFVQTFRDSGVTRIVLRNPS